MGAAGGACRWPADPGLNVPLLALCIGYGLLNCNYANHAGFRMVKESFGMTMDEATDYHKLDGSIHRGCGRVFAALVLNASIYVH